MHSRLADRVRLTSSNLSNEKCLRPAQQPVRMELDTSGDAAWWDTPVRRWQHPTTSSLRASQEANTAVPSWDRVHVQWDPPASAWPQCFQGQRKPLSPCKTHVLQDPGGLGGRGVPTKMLGEGFLEEKPPHSHSWGAATCSFSCSQPYWGHGARRVAKPALCED